MRKMLIAAGSGLALAATLFFATAPGNAAPAPTHITANEPVKCC